MAMALRERSRRTVACVLLAGLLAACASAFGVPANADSGGAELSAVRRSVVQQVGSEVIAPQTRKFVRIDVTEVVNPQKVPLSFHVHYRAPQDEPMLLGVFSLFPPDNPGTFIVPTQGQLRPGGAVSVQLVAAVDGADLQQVRVRLGRIAFVQR